VSQIGKTTTKHGNEGSIETGHLRRQANAVHWVGLPMNLATIVVHANNSGERLRPAGWAGRLARPLARREAGPRTRDACAPRTFTFLSRGAKNRAKRPPRPVARSPDHVCSTGFFAALLLNVTLCVVGRDRLIPLQSRQRRDQAIPPYKPEVHWRVPDNPRSGLLAGLGMTGRGSLFLALSKFFVRGTHLVARSAGVVDARLSWWVDSAWLRACLPSTAPRPA